MILSLRSVRPVPHIGGIVEAEDVLVSCLGARLHTVEPASTALGRAALASGHARRLITAGGLAHPFRIVPDPADEPPADLAVLLVSDVHDLTMMMGAEGWNRLADQVVVHVMEIGRRELRLYPDTFARLGRHVDHLYYCFSAIPPERLRRHRVSTVASVPGMVDVLRFPERRHEDRAIDVVNFGRRDRGQHQTLLSWADRTDRFYDYDTGPLQQVTSVAEHRRHFVQRLTRSRLVVANLARFDEPDRRRGGESVLGLRYWEAMAAGCAVVGEHPPGLATAHPDVAASGLVTFPVGSARLPPDVERVLEDPAESGRLGARARRVALLGHDVAHRWRQIEARAGLAPAPGISERIARLEAAAGPAG
ncbi:MAG: glycosyltransferase [Acidimicrobiia bacterium]|nr:glycosyltransferase [Acidimicrobiia bacterium]MDH4365696.1 glycosyltransferase [Acidimicrobiia bacterium]